MSNISLKSYDISSTNNPPVNADKLYQIGAMMKIKESLNKSKSKLDPLFDREDFQHVWNACDPFKLEKKRFSQITNAQHVSNAWLKCYEMICHYKLLPAAVNEKSFLHFDNAAFPGSFILATHHYAATRTDWLAKYDWRASSLIEQNDLNAAPISDKYGLYRNNKEKWLMNEENNGDVLLFANQENFMAQLEHNVDLYTSDLGFDVSSDFNNQELIQCPANIGQIISGLISLRDGGHFITKQYSIFEPITISVMYAAAQFFEKFYLCKPATSREANSETYLVGMNFKTPKNYLGDDIIEHPYIAALFDRIDRFTDKDAMAPLFLPEDYPKGYLANIRNIAQELADSQINKIEADIKRFEANDANILANYTESIEEDIENWYAANYCMPINEDQKLNTY